MINIKTNDVLKRLEFCEKSQEIALRLDYQYNRYNILYTMCLIELTEELIEKDISLKSCLRDTDEIVNINNKYKIIFFGHANISNAYEALLSLEKLMIKNYSLYINKILFKAAIVEKNKNNTSSEMIIDLKNLLLNNENSNNNFYIY